MLPLPLLPYNLNFFVIISALDCKKSGAEIFISKITKKSLTKCHINDIIIVGGNIINAKIITKKEKFYYEIRKISQCNS